MKNMTDIIYDTLMNNTDNEQFDIDKVEDQECNRKAGMINFNYGGTNFNIQVNVENQIESNNICYYQCSICGEITLWHDHILKQWKCDACDYGKEK